MFDCVTTKIGEIKKEKKKNSLTAAIDGISDRPGDPWETSIPKIIVGVSLIKGRCPECSIASKEFIPPSCVIRIYVQIF